MAEGTNKLGESVIEVRADLSKLPGDLAAAREMADKATAKPIDVKPLPTTADKSKPDASNPNASTPGASPNPVSPAVDEAAKVPEKVGPAVDTWNKYNDAVRKTDDTGRGMVQTLQNQTRVLTSFIGTVASVAAVLYTAARAGVHFGEQMFINQFDAAKFRHELERSTKSIEDFNAQREKNTERNFGPDLGGFGVTSVGKKLTEAVEAKTKADRELREFQESGVRRAGVLIDTALITTGIPIANTGQAVREEELMYEANMAATRLKFVSEQFKGMNERRPRPANTQSGIDSVDATAENTGEAVKILKMMDASRPR